MMDTQRTNAQRLSLGYLEVFCDAYRATLHDHDLPLSATQVDVLALLVANSERVVTRNELADAAGIDQASIDVVLSALRRVIGRGAIRNVRNRGWMIEAKAFRD